MYTDGTLYLMLMIALAAFKPPAEKEQDLALVVKRAKTRYFPAFEKVGDRDPVWIGTRPHPSGAVAPGCSRERPGPRLATAARADSAGGAGAWGRG